MFHRARQLITDLRQAWADLDAFCEAEKYARTHKPPVKARVTIFPEHRLGECEHADDIAQPDEWGNLG